MGGRSEASRRLPVKQLDTLEVHLPIGVKVKSVCGEQKFWNDLR